MRKSLIFSFMCILLFGCEENNHLSTCRFSYFNHKKIELFNQSEINIDFNKVHKILEGKGNIAKCKIIHANSKIIDSIWYEVITIYFPKKVEKIEFADTESNLLVYSAFGGNKNKKNYCVGYAKRGEIQFVGNKISLINVKLDFIGKETRKQFCEKYFGERRVNEITIK